VQHEIHQLRITSLEASQAFRMDMNMRSMAAQRAAFIAHMQIFICLDSYYHWLRAKASHTLFCARCEYSIESCTFQTLPVQDRDKADDAIGHVTLVLVVILKAALCLLYVCLYVKRHSFVPKPQNSVPCKKSHCYGE
jgi:hypothetical protein